jgi:hypothetical protein
MEETMEKEKRESLNKNIVGAIVIGVFCGAALAVFMGFVTGNAVSGIWWGTVAFIPILMSIADDLMTHIWSAKRSTRYIVQAVICIVALIFLAPRLLRLLPPHLLGQG